MMETSGRTQRRESNRDDSRLENPEIHQRISWEYEEEEVENEIKSKRERNKEEVEAKEKRRRERVEVDLLESNA